MGDTDEESDSAYNRRPEGGAADVNFPTGEGTYLNTDGGGDIRHPCLIVA